MRGLRLAAVWAILLSFVIAIPSAMAAEEWKTKICWKSAYKRGVGKIPICDQKHVIDGKLCYDPCKTGFKGVGPICWKACPSGYRDDGATCRRDVHIIASYGRGIGKVQKIEGGEKDAGLWYKKCNAGFKGIGPRCYPICVQPYHDDGGTCRRNAHIFGKEKYNRGVGTVPKDCLPGLKIQAGLCYPDCKPGHKGVGHICWQECKTTTTIRGIAMPTDCGTACSTTREDCTKWRGTMTKEAFELFGAGLDIFDPAYEAKFSEAMAQYPNVNHCP
jgi:hypothetical protein